MFKSLWGEVWEDVGAVTAGPSAPAPQSSGPVRRGEEERVLPRLGPSACFPGRAA